MDVAALIAWILAAGGGSYLLATWVRNGGTRRDATGTASRFPAGLPFGHFGLAAAGLIIWIIYLVTDSKALAWVSLILLILVAILGFTMFRLWLPSRGGGTATTTTTGTTAVNAASGTTGGTVATRAESHFPVAVVAAHGVLAVVTVVLVLIATLQS